MDMRKLIILVAVVALALAACGGGGTVDTTPPGPVGPGDAVAGLDVYKGSCAGCHGRDLAGISGLGLQLAPSDFVSQQTEDELVDFILVGLPASDPANTTGVDMPPKGGNTSLTDQAVHDVAAYLKAENE